MRTQAPRKLVPHPPQALQRGHNLEHSALLHTRRQRCSSAFLSPSPGSAPPPRLVRTAAAAPASQPAHTPDHRDGVLLVGCWAPRRHAARCARLFDFFSLREIAAGHTKSKALSLRFCVACLFSADLPPELLGGRIIAHAALNAASRLALFRCRHELAQLVLAHAPGSKRLTHLVTANDSSSGGGRWSATLVHLIGSRWQPLPSLLGLELHIVSSESPFTPPLLPRPPPATISFHTTQLHLERCLVTAAGLAAWQLHIPTLWPHLQHLTIKDAGPVDNLPEASPGQLQPAPRLLSLRLQRASSEALDAVLPLAANAQRLDLAGVNAAAIPTVLARLQRLTHVAVDRVADHVQLEAMLQHPTVQHVTCLSMSVRDLSQKPCRWRTLTVLEGLYLHFLAGLPVAQLERLTIRGSVNAVGEGPQDAGLEALRRLHAEGRLVLQPAKRYGHVALDMWRLPPGERHFTIWAEEGNAAVLMRLAVEAGQGPDGITCLCLGYGALPLSALRDVVAPVLQQSGRVTTLCLVVWHNTPVEWCTGLLVAVPLCVANVRMSVSTAAESQLRALVQGGVASLTHPLKLTLLHDEGRVSVALEAELRQIALGGAGTGGAGQQSLLTLEVVRR